MTKPRLSLNEIYKIRNLRKTGHTLYEIKNLTHKSTGTIWNYIQGVSILPKYKKLWMAKKGGSKAKSAREWKNAQINAATIIKKLGARDKMLILACLYWGEGNKRELNLINGDPVLIRTFITCLRNLGIQNEELKVSLRLFQDIDQKKAISFWARTLRLRKSSINKIETISGRKVGKLKYGMCRVRVRKSGKYFKLIVSMINLIKLRM